MAFKFRGISYEPDLRKLMTDYGLHTEREAKEFVSDLNKATLIARDVMPGVSVHSMKLRLMAVVNASARLQNEPEVNRELLVMRDENDSPYISDDAVFTESAKKMIAENPDGPDFNATLDIGWSGNGTQIMKVEHLADDDYRDIGGEA